MTAAEEPAVDAPPAETRGVCPACGRRAYLKGDGTVRSHRSPTPGVRCFGVTPDPDAEPGGGPS